MANNFLPNEQAEKATKPFDEYLHEQERLAIDKRRRELRRREERHLTREEQRLERRVARVMVITAAVFVALAAITVMATFSGCAASDYIADAEVVSVAPTVVITEAPVPADLPDTTIVESDPMPTPPPYSEQELEILALIIYQEAGGDACSDDTRMKVGNVFLNRVAHPNYPDTFAEVALQYKQYGRLYWTGLVWPDRANNPGEAHAVLRAYDIAERLLYGERVLPADVIFQSENIQGAEIVCHQDGLYFCR